MINGEYGNTLRVSAEEDITLNTNTIELRSPSPYVTTKLITSLDGLIVGVADKVAGGINFVAGQYVEYEFAEGDVNIAGEWEACLISLTPGGENKILGPLAFSVDAC